VIGGAATPLGSALLTTARLLDQSSRDGGVMSMQSSENWTESELAGENENPPFGSARWIEREKQIAERVRSAPLKHSQRVKARINGGGPGAVPGTVTLHVELESENLVLTVPMRSAHMAAAVWLSTQKEFDISVTRRNRSNHSRQVEP
jgi:hypothetical protein